VSGGVVHAHAGGQSAGMPSISCSGRIPCPRGDKGEPVSGRQPFAVFAAALFLLINQASLHAVRHDSGDQSSGNPEIDKLVVGCQQVSVFEGAMLQVLNFEVFQHPPQVQSGAAPCWRPE
jgi:hypothetical protein